MEASQQSGHADKVKIGTDVAASEFYKEGKYDLDFKNPASDRSAWKTGVELMKLYEEWTVKYPMISIEDPFDQDDWDSYAAMMKSMGDKVQIVGDDLLVTNTKRIAKALDVGACNALLLKINQIGSITESIDAANMSMRNGWGVMVSHRSGETEDSFIADLVVGLKTGQIKTGAPCRSERLSKYNQLLRIEEELGSKCSFAGEAFRSIGCPAKGMFRKPVVGGNWKCNGNIQGVKDLLKAFGGAADASAVEVPIFVPSVQIGVAQKLAPAGVSIGVQNVSKTKEGAFTGEVTSAQVKDLGLPWVLIGHSERRSIYGETNADCGEKVALAQAQGLMIMLCIGEQLSERKAGTTLDVCAEQLNACFPKITDWSKIVIAYEPVWAIGTGVVATPMQAQETHYGVRKLVRDKFGNGVADAVRILYGGSVSPGNCAALGELPDIDGFLVGGASMKPNFTDIISTAKGLYKK